MRKVFIAIFMLLFLVNPGVAGTIAGWFYHENCNSFGCFQYGGNPSGPPIVIVEREGQINKILTIKPTDESVDEVIYGWNLRYEGHIFDSNGNLYLIATHTDCLGDNSYQECLIVAKFDPEGTRQALKVFYSNYRQTDPMFALVETSMFFIKQISLYNGRLEILLDYPKTPTILFLDSQLNIEGQIAVPWIGGNPPELNSIGGKWLALNNNILIDLSRGVYYTISNSPSNYISQVFDLSEGPIVFYSAYTGFLGTSKTYIKQYRITNSGLALGKYISIRFPDYGFPGFLKVSRTGSGWLAYLSLWRNFGGDVSYGVLKADFELNRFQFYTIKGSFRNGWPLLDNDTGMLPIEDCSLSDENGELYLSLALDRAHAVVSLDALPLEEPQIEAVASASFNETNVGNRIQFSPVSYIVECSNCKQFEVSDLTETGPFAVVKKPGMLYGTSTSRSGTYRTDFFCYAPPGYKAYCGFALGNKIYIYDAVSGLVEFLPERMDAYKPLTEADVPIKILSIDLCTGYYDTPTLPDVKVDLIDFWIPENMSLTEAIESNSFDFTVIPWEAPDCR